MYKIENIGQLTSQNTSVPNLIKLYCTPVERLLQRGPLAYSESEGKL